MEFLRNLSKKIEKSENVTLFYDGLSVHKYKEAVEFIKNNLKWDQILNIAYCSENNLIEYSFCQIKNRFRNNY